VEPSGYQRLDDAALQFVKSHWRWQPAMRAGKPVVATTRVSVLFDLKPPPLPSPPKSR
jgi:outer membrane biosynthesis protein TonB